MREKKRSGIPSSASALELVPAKEQDEAKDALRKVVSTMDVADGSWDGEDEELEQEVRKQHVVSEVLFLSSIGATKRLTSVFEEDPQLIDCSDYDRRTPLHVAAGNGKTSVVSKILFAASAGDLDSVMELVEQDVQLKDCADYDKRTPLHLACSEGQSHVAKWLLEQGTNPSPVDRLFDKGHFITLEEHNNKVAMRDIDWEIPRSQLEEMPAETRMMKSGTFGHTKMSFFTCFGYFKA
eukprot:jgi/Pico_ML_1/55732/g1380.t1